MVNFLVKLLPKMYTYSTCRLFVYFRSQWDANGLQIGLFISSFVEIEMTSSPHIV